MKTQIHKKCLKKNYNQKEPFFVLIRFLLFLYFLLTNITYAQVNPKQEKSIDSLVKIIKDKNAYLNMGSKEMLRISTEIYYQSEGIDYDRGKLEALYCMSLIYLNEQDHGMALKKTSEGKFIAQKNKNDEMLSFLLLNEGMIYMDLGYTKKSRTALQKSLGLADKINNQNISRIRASVFRTLARNISKERGAEKNDSVLIFLKKGYGIANKMSNKFSYKRFYQASFAIDLANEYYTNGEFSQCEKYLIEFQKYLKFEKDKSDLIYYYLLKGSIENKRKNYLRALEYFDESTQLVQQYRIYKLTLKDIYSGKAEAYSGLNDYKNQAIFATKSKKITDSISSTEKKMLNDMILTDHINNPIKSKMKFNYYIIILILTTLGGSVCILLVMKRRLNKKKKNNEEYRSVEILSPNKSLSVEEKIDTEIEDIKKLIVLVQTNDKSFHVKFCEVFPLFNQKLLALNPQLTHTDLECCALIKLKFDTKEIARYKNASVNSIVSKKYRIRKKLHISTTENIYTWMLDIN